MNTNRNSKARILPVHLPVGNELSGLPLYEETMKVTVGGATVFTLDVEAFVQL